jgi:branched-chain amino acid transport system permease protein
MTAVSGFFHGIANRFRGLPKWVRVILLVLLALLVYLLPILNPPLITTTGSDFGAVLFLCALYALVAVGLNVVIGYAGLLDLGYIGFFAIGAYTVGVLGSAHAKLPLLLCIPAAMVVTLIS